MRGLRVSKPATPIGPSILARPNEIGPSIRAGPNECIIHDPCAPPTLGECLTERITENGHTHEDAASALGTISLEIRWWVSDSYVPDPEIFGALMTYLGVDLDILRGLILRSQMRQVQRRLRGMPD